MRYCPICGTDHDPDLPCADKASQVLRSAGIEKRSGMPAREFAELSREARSPVIIYFVLVAGAVFLSLLIKWLLR
jgi:hypothetical protein